MKYFKSLRNILKQTRLFIYQTIKPSRDLGRVSNFCWPGYGNFAVPMPESVQAELRKTLLGYEKIVDNMRREFERFDSEI